MLQRTFCHLPGVGIKTERRLWEQGIISWELMVARATLPPRLNNARKLLEDSISHLQKGNAEFFAATLGPQESWRMFHEYKDHVAYVDIETTGGTPGNDHITAIALYDGRTVRTYVYGENLEQFEEDIADTKLLVTFNGKCFDVPVIERELRIRMPEAHIDLRHLLAGLGYRGGLKRCEKAFGLNRDELDGVDGYFAVLFWNEYQRTGDPKILETLLAYNVEDVISLEILLHHAINLKLEQTPFYSELACEVPRIAANPHRAHQEVVLQARENMFRYSVPRWFQG
ncbi:MAG: ribonuclease H-like domain-containing protein [Desulfovibrionales bacterium]